MLDKEELWNIRKFTTKSESDKAFHSLEGLLNGINEIRLFPMQK